MTHNHAGVGSLGGRGRDRAHEQAHGHDHAHSHLTGHGESGTGNLQVAFFLNVGFAILELIGGVLTGSLAIMSDALHDLGDSVSLGLAWAMQRLSLRRGDARFSFGYRRFSLLGALVNTLILVIGASYVIAEAIPRLSNPVQPNAQGMLILAFVGIAVNGLAAYRLSRDRTLNARAVTLHLMEDVLGWAGVLLVSVVLLFRSVPILDPILSIVISIWVFYNAVRGLRQAAGLFLQAVPADIDLSELQDRLTAIPGVLSVHHTHVWSLDGERHVFSAHIVVPETTSHDQMVEIKCLAREASEHPEVAHTTLELEYMSETCPMRDVDCATGLQNGREPEPAAAEVCFR